MKKMWLLPIPALLLIVVFALTGARKHSIDLPMQAQPSSYHEGEEKVRAVASIAADKKQNVERKIIQSGEVTIEVKHYEPFFQGLEERMKILDGYLSNIEIRRNGELVSSASLTLRVPPARLHTMLSWLREQGNLTSERIHAEDISEQYYDLKSRLENARRFETRLLEMLKQQTGNLQELILVEEKLNQIREQIEQMEGQTRYYDALTNLATLTLHVQVESVYVPPQKTSFASRLMYAWNHSVAKLFETAQGFAVAFVALFPWLLPLAAMLFIFRQTFRYLRRKTGRSTATA